MNTVVRSREEAKEEMFNLKTPVKRSWFGLALAVLVLYTHPANAQSCAAPANPIVAENCLTGNPASEWDISGVGSTSIQGFSTDISVNKGGTIQFKIRSTSATAYRLDIYRSGYYNGNGARKVATVNPSVSLPQSQPNCLTNAATGLVDCGNWAVSASWTVPSTSVSGVYFAKLVATAGITGSSHIVFIVRDDASTSDILYQTSDPTWQAYNDYGGNSLYTGSPAGRAYKVSYNRPFSTRAVDGGQDWYFANEYPMVRWIESNGYNVTYSSGVDTDRRGSLLLQHKLFLSVGHDEYWSGGQRANVENAREQGVHLAFFSGNEVFWKTRWENSIDGSGTAYRTLVCYKETHAGAKIDPTSTWTGTWRDPRFSPPADGGRPENNLTGTIFMVNSGSQAIRVSEQEGKLRFWRNTAFANLAPGASGTTTAGVIGYESDDAPNDANAPAGLMRLSTTVFDVSSYLLDYGSTYGVGTSTHNLTLYRRPSGALVFGAGSIRWSWGLDGNHDLGGSVADVKMQQATVNLFADMNVQPATLRSGLVPASASTDTTAPVTVITSPAAGAQLSQGTQITVTGTASDVGGRLVAVEISTDGGTTWKRATGTSSWTFNWSPAIAGTASIKSRGVDDSGNFETPGSGTSVTVTGRSCPCTIWSAASAPVVANDPEAGSIEVGVKFTSAQAGTITAIRFYKGSQNTGTHVGNLWSLSGTKLGTGTFANETASGWQQVNLQTPVQITANTTYVASYYAPVGHYAWDEYALASGVDSSPLRALSDGEAGGNGVYRYGSTGFPNSSYHAANFWVDVVFVPANSDTTPPTISSVQAAPNSSSALITWTTNEASNSTVNYGTSAGSLTLSASDGSMVTNHSVSLTGLTTGTYYYRVNSADAAGNTATSPTSGALSFTVVDNIAPTISSVIATPGNTTAAINWNTNEPATSVVQYGTSAASLNQSVTIATLTVPHSVTLTGLNPGTIYYYRVVSADASGNSSTSPTSGALNFTTTIVTGPSCPCTVFSSSAVPGSVNDPETASLEVGMKFRSSVAGTITGIRFYKGSLNTGTHIGSLWNLSGTRLGTATFQNETASGWQQVNFSTPVAITANTTYVASYFAPNGRYAFDEFGFTNGVDNAPLRGLSDSEAVGNGVYLYGAASAYPNQTYHAANYWVDVVFMPANSDTTAPTISNVTATPNASGAVITWTTDEASNSTVNYGSSSGSLTSTASDTALVTSHSVTLTGLAAGTYYFRVNSADAASNSAASPVAPGTLSFIVTDTVAPVISSVTATPSTTSATITWTTDEGSTTVVQYGTSAASLNLTASNTSLVSSHSISLTGLTSGTPYFYRVSSADATGNTATSPTSGSLTFTTTVPAPPAITAVSASATSTTATITWTTDRASNSVVNYGTSSANLNLSATVATMVTAHSVPLSGLTAGTTYYFRVSSTDAGSLSATSPNPPAAPASFTTATAVAGPTISAVTATAGLDGSARITWTTNVASTSVVQFGTNSAALDLSSTDATLVTAHVVNLTGLTYGTTYYYRVTSVTSAGGSTTSPNPPAVPSSFAEDAISLFPTTAVPSIITDSDASAVVLGMKFTSQVAGYIKAIRFYKGPTNTGSHTARIFSSTGTSLANVTFSGETASGWQQQNLTTPLAIAANTTYVVSYRAPVGHYSADSNYFANGVTRGPLTAPSSAAAGGNGVYIYGTATAFPNQTWQASNYWVDIVFSTTP